MVNRLRLLDFGCAFAPHAGIVLESAPPSKADPGFAWLHNVAVWPQPLPIFCIILLVSPFRLL